MSLFEDIVNESVLSEDGARKPGFSASKEEKLLYAINNVRRLRIKYDDKKDDPNIPWSKQKGKNERYVLPVAYGLTRRGKKAFRAYQSAGSTKRGLENTDGTKPKANHWKMFILDNCQQLGSTYRSFAEYRDQLIRAGLNTKGDKSMIKLYAITPLADGNVQVEKDTNPINSEPLTHQDVAPSPSTQKPTSKPNSQTVSAKTKRNTPIDNKAPKQYLNNKIDAPETEPIAKTDISTATKPQPSRVTKTTPKKVTTSPIQKSDIEDAKPTADNKLTNSFKDMTDRMDNLYNDEEK